MNKSLRQNTKYRYIRSALAKRYDKEALSQILTAAEAHYVRLAARCEGAAPGEQFHLTNTILPTAAIYLALKGSDPDSALTVTTDALLGLCSTANKAAQIMLHIPGMKALFMRLLPKMALRMFGRESGFDYTHFAADRTRLEMDTTVCPYCKYAALLEVSELMPLFCQSDFATYGNLPGIRFERTQTLGTGGSKCDFRFIRE